MIWVIPILVLILLIEFLNLLALFNMSNDITRLLDCEKHKLTTCSSCGRDASEGLITIGGHGYCADCARRYRG